jgi:hypothetical protein
MRSSGSVLCAYSLLSFLFFGLRLVLEPGSQYLGAYDDPQILIWSFAWWPHAILHGQNPFVAHAIWPPGGVNLTWGVTVPGLALLFSPLTLTAGPVAAYNVAAILMPGLAAWTAFLLCRHITRAFWPSCVGGYLFGFSSFVVTHEWDQLQVVALFAIPLVALVVLRYLEGSLGGRGLALRLAVLIAFQILTSTELAFTLTLALAAGLVLGFLFVRSIRGRIVSALVPLASGYALAAMLTAPFFYYVLTGFRLSAFNPPELYVADLANLVVPTHLEALGGGWTSSIVSHFPGNSTERGSFLGPPALVIVGLFAWRRWRTAAGRFLLAALGLAILASLGTKLTFDGHGLIPLPTLFGHNSLDIAGAGRHLVPLFNNVLPVRIMVYATLATAVIVAVWTASGRGIAHWLLPALAILALLPNPWAGSWSTTYTIPPFFTKTRYQSCLGNAAIVLPEPVAVGGQALLWQVASDFRFRMTGGRLPPSPPTAFLHPNSIAQISVGYPPIAGQSRLFAAFFKTKGVTDVIVDPSRRAVWAPSLDRIATPHEIGGVVLYHISGARPPCPTS